MEYFNDNCGSYELSLILVSGSAPDPHITCCFAKKFAGEIWYAEREVMWLWGIAYLP
jgi:hypothetical protein